MNKQTNKPTIWAILPDKRPGLCIMSLPWSKGLLWCKKDPEYITSKCEVSTLFGYQLEQNK